MIIKQATEAGEFFQIHQLNYKTFVEEIPQACPFFVKPSGLLENNSIGFTVF